MPPRKLSAAEARKSRLVFRYGAPRCFADKRRWTATARLWRHSARANAPMRSAISTIALAPCDFSAASAQAQGRSSSVPAQRPRPIAKASSNACRQGRSPSAIRSPPRRHRGQDGAHSRGHRGGRALRRRRGPPNNSQKIPRLRGAADARQAGCFCMEADGNGVRRFYDHCGSHRGRARPDERQRQMTAKRRSPQSIK